MAEIRCEATVRRVYGETPCNRKGTRIAGKKSEWSGEVAFVNVCGTHFAQLLRNGWFDAEAVEPVEIGK